MESNQKEKPWYKKLKGLLIIFLITTTYIILQFYLNDIQKNNVPIEKINIESSAPVIIPGFELYTDKSKGFQILFPEQPEVTTFNLSSYPVTHYKSLSISDNDNFIQYSVTYTDTEIYSTESINAYLNSFIKGKIIGLGDDVKVTTSQIKEYKGFPARKYLIEYTSDGMKIRNKGISFIANGDSINLSVSYPFTMNINDTYFNEFTSSFILK